ncbi:MAG: hypothetical protein K6F64_09765 [Clostridia bacterium]|nr:hypothetical protein [Clostridia bacterium]
MASGELKKLNRKELLELIIETMRENERKDKLIESLSSENASLSAAAEKTRIDIETSGSLAQACAKLGGIFETADKTSALFLRETEIRAGETLSALADAYEILLSEKLCAEFTKAVESLGDKSSLTKDDFTALVVQPLIAKHKEGCNLIALKAKESFDIGE